LASHEVDVDEAQPGLTDTNLRADGVRQLGLLSDLIEADDTSVSLLVLERWNSPALNQIKTQINK